VRRCIESYGGARVVRRERGSERLAARRAGARRPRGAVRPNWIVHATAAPAPNDPLLAQLGDLARDGAPVRGSTAARRVSPPPAAFPSGSSIPRRSDATRPRRQDAGLPLRDVCGGQCATRNEHGTHVAGTIGALANNGEGVAGSPFDSPLIVVQGARAGRTAAAPDDVAALHRRRRNSRCRSAARRPHTLAGVKRRETAGAKTGSVLVAAAGNEATTRPITQPAPRGRLRRRGRERSRRISNRNPDSKSQRPSASSRRSSAASHFLGLSRGSR